jgi:hypothetical protein
MGRGHAENNKVAIGSAGGIQQLPIGKNGRRYSLRRVSEKYQ